MSVRKNDYEFLTELHVLSSTINVEFNVTEVSILLSDYFLLSYEGRRKPKKMKSGDDHNGNYFDDFKTLFKANNLYLEANFLFRAKYVL
jgi:hypothetical protein